MRDDNRDICLQHGGILPEPRSSEENEFLNSLNTDLFLLGMSDVETEGTWLWDSDGTPVVWTNWSPTDPPGGTDENCAAMLRTLGNAGPEWATLLCAYTSAYDEIAKSLICQKGICFSVV